MDDDRDVPIRIDQIEPKSKRGVVANQFRTLVCVGLVILGLILTLPWWAFIGWLAMIVVERL